MICDWMMLQNLGSFIKKPILFPKNQRFQALICDDFMENNWEVILNRSFIFEKRSFSTCHQTWSLLSTNFGISSWQLLFCQLSEPSCQSYVPWFRNINLCDDSFKRILFLLYYYNDITKVQEFVKQNVLFS